MGKNSVHIKSRLVKCAFTTPSNVDILSAQCNFSLQENKDNKNRFMVNGLCLIKNSNEESDVDDSTEDVFLTLELHSYFEKNDSSSVGITEEDRDYFTQVCFNEIKLIVSQLTSYAFGSPIFIPDFQDGQSEDEEGHN